MNTNYYEFQAIDRCLTEGEMNDKQEFIEIQKAMFSKILSTILPIKVEFAPLKKYHNSIS